MTSTVNGFRSAAAAALLTFSILVLTLISGPGTGSSLCVPGLSLRCEWDECSSEYVRCGRSQQRQKVPDNKVCYKGALIPTSSEMHILRSTLFPDGCSGRRFTIVNSTKASNVEATCDTVICNASCSSGSERCYCQCHNGIKQGSECDCNSKCNCSRKILVGDISSYFKRLRDFLRHQFTFPPADSSSCCSP